MLLPKISVIVPVYNTGDSVKKCLETLEKQTLKEVEFIFVDDCGTDQSMEILEKAAAADKRIRIIRNPYNIGTGNSRNVGIENATGEYLSFVDPDDYIAYNFLELLYKKTKNKPDIVKGLRRRIDIEGNLCDEDDISIQVIREGLKKGKPLFNLFRGGHWSAIYRREFILSSGARYGKSNNHEDTTFQLKATYYAKSIEFADRAYYYYVARDGSNMRNYSESRILGELNSFQEKMDFLIPRFHESEDYYSYVLFFISFMLRLHLKMTTIDQMQKISEQFLVKLRENVSALPFVDGLMQYDVLIKGLVVYGVNLSTDPYEKVMNVPDFIEYKQMVINWVAFIRANPEYQYEYQTQIRKVFISALGYDNWKHESSIKRKEYQEIRRLAGRLPDTRVLTDSFMRMEVFVKYGINLFGFRDPSNGKIIRRLLRIISRIRHSICL